jgi:16S rRNA (cytidine1402-2'-O)-methyltransferase
MSTQQGLLYVVATPIGNLDDLSPRACRILSGVDRIVVEDTRHSGSLLKHFSIKKPMVSLHEHNEREQSGKLIEKLQNGESIALISDAGTPLISDPGFHLIRAAHQEDIPVIAIPGPSALIAALSVSGLPTDRFMFEGFLPSRSAARKEHLNRLVEETCTLIFYESCHRIVASIQDMLEIFGEEREVVIARELTKKFETVKLGNMGALSEWLQADANQQKGEFVVLVHGAKLDTKSIGAEEKRVLKILLEELPVKQAAALASRLTGLSKNLLYKQALEISASEV